jgi:hypothetical protein
MGEITSRNTHAILKYTPTALVATTPDIDFSLYAGGLVILPAGSPVTQLTFFASVTQPTTNNLYGDPNDTTKSSGYQQVNDANNPLTVAAGQAYAIPANCFGAKGLRITFTGGTVGPFDVGLKA